LPHMTSGGPSSIAQRPVLPPTPANAAPGVQLNPAWNEAWPLTSPQHDGSPQQPGALGFGDVGDRIGSLLSASSSMHPSQPQPTWESSLGVPIAVGLAGAGVTFLVLGGIRRALFSVIWDLTYKTDFSFIAGAFSTVGSFVVLIGAVVVGGGLLWFSRRFVKAQPKGPTLWCRMVGSEGFAVCQRTPLADTLTVVRYQDVSLLCERAKTTTTVKNQYGRVLRTEHSEKLNASWENAQDQVVHRTYASSYSLASNADAVFHEAAERAYTKVKGELVMSMVQLQGWTFKLRTTNGQIYVSTSRIDFSINGANFSTAPRDITSIGLNQGRVTFNFRGGAPLSVALSHIRDGKLLLLVLDSMRIPIN
jgi:hypothetical protein